MLCYNCMCEKGEETICPYCGYENVPDPAAHHLTPSTVLGGRYTLGRVLGEGGFGITYIGYDHLLDVLTAIKEFFPYGISHRNSGVSNTVTVSTGRNNEVYETRKHKFLSEAKILARFSDEPGIVNVSNYIEENNTAYIVMEYLDGVDLRTYLRQNGPMSVYNTLTLLMPVMYSLNKLHQAGVIHRDIAPDNLMVLSDGSIKLMDFGSARDYITDERSMSVMLKKGYAPLEQYSRNGDQGPWTDVYAMCATIYRCITGKTPDDAIDRSLCDELVPPSQLGVYISASVENALMYGLAIYQKDRCQSMSELYMLFEQASTAGVFAQPVDTAAGSDSQEISVSEDVYNPYLIPEQIQPAQQKKRKKKLPLVIAIIAAAVLALGGLAFWFFTAKTTEITYDEYGNRIETVYLMFNKRKLSETAYYPDGSVHTVTEYGSDGNSTKKTEYDGEGNPESEEVFDSEGNTTKVIDYDADGNVARTSEYEYDSDGRTTKATINNPDGTLFLFIEYEYDSSGNLTRETDTYFDNVKHVFESFNSFGYAEKKTIYLSDGTELGHGKFEYDSNGNVKEYTFNYADGCMSTAEDYTENGEGQKETFYFANGAVKYTGETEYNTARNNTIKETCHFKLDDTTIVRYEYNEFNYPTKAAEYNPDGIEDYHAEMEYDDNGTPVKTTIYFADGKKQIIDEFDENGMFSGSTMYSSDGLKLFTVEYEYNFTGNYYTKQTQYNHDKTKYVMEGFNDFNEGTKKTKYKADGSEDYHTALEYDKDGKLIKTTTDYSDKTKSVAAEFNRFDKPLTEVFYTAGGDKDHTAVYEYDSYGNPTKSVLTYTDGRKEIKEDYDCFDNEGKMTEYGSDGNKKYTYTYEYDDNGVLTKTTKLDANGKVLETKDH